MTLSRTFALTLALVLLSPLLAQAQSPPPLGKPVFCEGPYALCIRALCAPVLEKGSVKKAV